MLSENDGFLIIGQIFFWEFSYDVYLEIWLSCNILETRKTK